MIIMMRLELDEIIIIVADTFCFNLADVATPLKIAKEVKHAWLNSFTKCVYTVCTCTVSTL